MKYKKIATKEVVKLLSNNNVVIMAESVPLENPKTGKKEKSCRYFKAKVLETHTAEEINEVVKQNIDN